MKRKKKLLIFFLFLIALVNFGFAKAQNATTCVTCTQSLPICGPDEELVPQTCEHCTFCKKKEGLNVSCVICAQFVPECGPGEELVLQTCEHCAHCKPNSTTSSSSGSVTCEVPCGKRCCKTGKQCVTIDRCKGIPNCKKLPKFKCVKSNPSVSSE